VRKRGGDPRSPAGYLPICGDPHSPNRCDALRRHRHRLRRRR